MSEVSEREGNITTWRPDGKKGITMLKSHYSKMVSYVLALLDSRDDVTLNELLECAQTEFSDSIDSDVAWYILQVKLDLEARDLIRVVSAQHNKRVFFLRITRQGQKKVRLERQLDDWNESNNSFED